MLDALLHSLADFAGNKARLSAMCILHLFVKKCIGMSESTIVLEDLEDIELSRYCQSINTSNHAATVPDKDGIEPEHSGTQIEKEKAKDNQHDGPIQDK